MTLVKSLLFVCYFLHRKYELFSILLNFIIKKDNCKICTNYVINLVSRLNCIFVVAEEETIKSILTVNTAIFNFNSNVCVCQKGKMKYWLNVG